MYSLPPWKTQIGTDFEDSTVVNYSFCRTVGPCKDCPCILYLLILIVFMMATPREVAESSNCLVVAGPLYRYTRTYSMNLELSVV
jgi:hypothetical protein